MWTPVVIAAVLAAWTAFYIWTDYRWKPHQYVWTKLTASLLFLAIAVSAFLALGARADYAVWVIIALCFGLIGDVLLVFSKRPAFFIGGLTSFLLGQVVYGVTFARFTGFHWVDILIYVALVGGALIAQRRVRLDFGRMKIPVLAYMLIISFMFTMALGALYKPGFSPIVTAAIVSGAALFTASDIVLAFVLFAENPKKPLRAVNLSLYYTAQMILALSVAAMAL